MTSPTLQYDIVLFYDIATHAVEIYVDGDLTKSMTCVQMCYDLGVKMPKVEEYTHLRTTFSRDNSTPPESEGLTTWTDLDAMHECDEAIDAAQQLLNTYRNKFYPTAKIEVI